jgi:molybdopterin synthase catalytic subunit
MIDWVDFIWDKLYLPNALEFVYRDQDTWLGGINVFVGVTRAETRESGEVLLSLDYEAYEEMARGQMGSLARRAAERWPISRLVILHRLGRVMVGEPSVVIGVATPHRAEAFEACRWLIDSLKAEVAIWKKEEWSDGPPTWVEGTEIRR